MSNAIITLQDVDGSVGVGITFDGGFSPESNAHQHAFLIQKWLDENLTRLEEPTIAKEEPAILVEV